MLALVHTITDARKLKQPQMNAIADAARILSNLGSLGSQFLGLDANLTPPGMDSGGSGEYLAASVTGMTGSLGGMLSSRQIVGGIWKGVDSVATLDRNRVGRIKDNARFEAAYEKHTKNLYLPGLKVKTAYAGGLIEDGSKITGAQSAVTNILPWAISVVGYLEYLLGFGPPCDGADLVSGAQQFGGLAEQLTSALPHEDWQGDASQAYASQVVTLQGIAQAIANSDLRLAEIVENQAEWVTHMRLGFGILLNILTAAVVVEVALRIFLAPVGGEAWAKAWAISVSALAITIALGMLTALTILSAENAQEADSVTSDLAQQVVAATAVQLTGNPLADTDVSAAAQSRFSDFEAISTGMSGGFAGPGYVQPAPEYRRTSAGETPNRAQGEDATQDEGNPLTMPTLGALIRMSGQTGDNSGQHSQRATPRTGQRSAAVPEAAAAEHATLAGDVEATGAGAGTEATDRAPIDVAAVDNGNTQGPTPA
jgi:EspA/EspE family